MRVISKGRMWTLKKRCFNLKFNLKRSYKHTEFQKNSTFFKAHPSYQLREARIVVGQRSARRTFERLIGLGLKFMLSPEIMELNWVEHTAQ